jgi:hypothetical protein
MKTRTLKIIFVSLVALEILIYAAGSISLFVLAPFELDANPNANLGADIVKGMVEWTLVMIAVVGCTFLVYRKLKERRISRA